MATKAAASAATNAAKRTAPKSADPFKYHLTEKSPFWRKFREALAVNPEINTGTWNTPMFRHPQPASRPEKYARPPTRASDPAQNAYYERDFRRQYPRLDVITQNDLSALLLAQPEQLNLPAPNTSRGKQASEGVTDVTTLPSPAPTLSSLYLAPSSSSSSSTASEASTFYSKGKLPPTPVAGIKVAWSQSKEKVQADPYAYFPMDNYSSTIVKRKAGDGHHYSLDV